MNKAAPPVRCSLGKEGKGGRGWRGGRGRNGTRSKAMSATNSLAVAIKAFGCLSLRAGGGVLCCYIAVTSGEPTNGAARRIWLSTARRRECAQHRLPQLKARGPLLQSIVAAWTPHSDSGHHHHGTVMASWLLFLHPVILSVILSVMFLLYLERAGGLIYRELFRAA